MAIPDFQTLMLPLLKYLSNVESSKPQECIKYLSNQFHLSNEEVRELLPSGRQTIFANRVHWAKTYLSKAGLVESVSRGVWSISETGKKELENQSLARIDLKYLMNFDKVREFRSLKSKKDSGSIDGIFLLSDGEKSPRELLEESYTQIREDLAHELLQKVKECSPEFFEKLVIDLLLKMGYGGSRSDAGKAIGQTGDGGIDGIIHEDRLGLDNIYIQAKRWDDTTVGQPEIQKFVGAMAGRHGGKGVFITTSSFSQNAIKYAATVQGMRIKLIDGRDLAQYMIDFDIGTAKEESYVLKRIDSDYFLED